MAGTTARRSLRLPLAMLLAAIFLGGCRGGVSGSAGGGGRGGGAGNDGGGGAPLPTGENSPPKLISAGEIQRIAEDTADWSARRAACDAGLDQLVGPDYAGWGWRTAVESYGVCYLVARHLGLDGGVVASYANKTIALMKVLARHHVYGTPAPTQELVGRADGRTLSFSLRMPPAAGATVAVYLTSPTELTLTYAGARAALAGGFHPILEVSDAAGGPARYVAGRDYKLSYPGDIEWIGAHPAMGASYHVTVADQAFTKTTGATAAGTTLTFAAAPPAGQAIYVEYLGPGYEQTGNYLGGDGGAIRPDSGYLMRTLNVGLAEGYDFMRQAPELTPALRQELLALLGTEVDWFQAYVRENPYVDGELGNYFVRGHLMGTLFSALATDDDNPRARAGGDLKPLARQLLLRTVEGLRRSLPGGYGPEGSYDSGTNGDELQLFDVWKRNEGEDFASMLAWTSHVVPAIVHGTKPDRRTFYDGGDWSDLPAVPPLTTLRAFVTYQPEHAMAPYARQLLADLGAPVAGAAQSYRTGPGAFPLSYHAEGTGPIYARSDWAEGAIWLSLSGGPVFELGHQHLDRGHFTLQRGADYLIVNSGQYGDYHTLPWHNTLGFDDRGSGDHIVYPPGQGAWAAAADEVPARHVEGGGFVYGQEDFGAAYVNNDGKTNSVVRAVRTVVFIRPDVVVLHDQAVAAQAGVKKTFNLSFNAPSVERSGDVFSAVTGGSRVFMRALLPPDPAPVILPPEMPAPGEGGKPQAHRGSSYQLTISGRAADSFLHVFQAVEAGRGAMAATAYVESADGRAHGVEVEMGARRWVVLAAATAPRLGGGAVAYPVPMACPCSHVVGDLAPMAAVRITTNRQTLTASADGNGVLTFVTEDAATANVELVLP